MSSAIPNEFLQLNLTNVRRKNAHEWSSACPKCGGKDRFYFMDNARGAHKIYGECRQCGYKFFNKKSIYNPLLRREYAERRKKEETVNTILKEASLETFQKKDDWKQYHEIIPVEIRDLWHKRGLSDKAIDYYGVGYRPVYYTEQGEETNALTIPCFDFKGNCTQIYYRLLKHSDGGKYRQTKGVPPALFFADRDYKDFSDVFLIEGQIKAMVVNELICDDSIKKYCSYYKDMQVVGMPSATPSDELIVQLKQAKRLWLNHDPDMYGKEARTRFIERLHKLLPDTIIYDAKFIGKLDDEIVAGFINLHQFTKVLKYSIRIS